MDAPETARPSARTGSTRVCYGTSSPGRPGIPEDVGAPESGAVNHADAGAPAAAPVGLGPTSDHAMAFHSILVPPGAEGLAKNSSQEPEFFPDLNLDKIVAAITAGKDGYNLRPFFYSPIRDLPTIAYRHDVMRDLEHDDILQMVRSFAQGMQSTRQHLALSAKLHYPHQKRL